VARIRAAGLRGSGRGALHARSPVGGGDCRGGARSTGGDAACTGAARDPRRLRDPSRVAAGDRRGPGVLALPAPADVGGQASRGGGGTGARWRLPLRVGRDGGAAGGLRTRIGRSTATSSVHAGGALGIAGRGTEAGPSGCARRSRRRGGSPLAPRRLGRCSTPA